MTRAASDLPVPAFDSPRGSNEARLQSLVIRVADCSVALFQELLDDELGSP
jgi:hypothetical protein